MHCRTLFALWILSARAINRPRACETALSFLHFTSRTPIREKERVMRRQRNRSARAVRRYFCIITDTVLSEAGHHGGEVQGTSYVFKESRSRRGVFGVFPPMTVAEIANVATDSWLLRDGWLDLERSSRISNGNILVDFPRDPLDLSCYLEWDLLKQFVLYAHTCATRDYSRDVFPWECV